MWGLSAPMRSLCVILKMIITIIIIIKLCAHAYPEVLYYYESSAQIITHLN